MNNRRLLKLWLVLVVVALILIIGSQVTAQETARVVVRPASGDYDPGDEFEVEIWVEDVTNLYGADIQLTFNPTKLAVVGEELVPNEDLLQPDFVVRQLVDNSTGHIWYAASQLRPTEPANGSGALFSIRMRALDDGFANLTILKQILANRDGEAIPAEEVSARYRLGDAAYELFMPAVAGRFEGG